MLTAPQEFSLELPNTGTEGTHRIACWQWGDPAAKDTVICVHGLTRNGRDFDVLAAELSQKYRVLCPDMPGRGKSDWLADPAGYNYAAYTADMLAFIKSLLPLEGGAAENECAARSSMRGGEPAANISSVVTPTQPSPLKGEGKIHYIGTSMGGIIGMMVQNAAPGLIRSLVLNDIGCLVEAAGLKRILSYAGVPAVLATRAEAETQLRERCAPFGIKSEEHWQIFFAHSIVQNPGGTFRFACDPAITANIASGKIKDVDLWPLWELVAKIPLLLIRGAHSDILSPDTAQKMQATHPRLTFREIADAGHAPALMAEDQIALIKNWLETN